MSQPRILIDPSSHHLLNAGDVAMLQICVERLRASHPRARLEVLTTAPELLARHCAGTHPIPAAGRYALTGSHPYVPRPRPIARSVLARAGRRLALKEPAVQSFVDAMLGADLLLFSGRGGLTDAFPEETDAVLTELEIAARIGLPVALLGQGVGPLEDRRANARMAATLPRVVFASLREGRAAPALLEAVGVPHERIQVTGDDAIELAFRNRADRLGEAVGLNTRVAGYTGFAAEAAERIGSCVGEWARARDVAVIPIGISSHPHEDETVAPKGAGTQATAIATPDAAIAATARCRVVVAGSYHAAVFALSQGIPVVGLAASPYYVDKLLGLRERFGDGCRVVLVARDLDDTVLSAVTAELHRQWTAAPALRGPLLAAAEQQVALSRAAHERVAAAVGSGAEARVGRPPVATPR